MTHGGERDSLNGPALRGAKPFYEKHYQPRLPTDLGYYDCESLKREMLRRNWQKHTVYMAFATITIGSGARSDRMSRWERSCNQRSLISHFAFVGLIRNWTRRWDGMDNEILISQTASSETELAFIQDVIPLLEGRQVYPDKR